LSQTPLELHQAMLYSLYSLLNVKTDVHNISKLNLYFPQNVKCINSRVNVAKFYIYEYSYYYHVTYSAHCQIYIEANTTSSVIHPQDGNCNVCRNIQQSLFLQASCSRKMSPLIHVEQKAQTLRNKLWVHS
jgi:hypothetical protein